MHADKRVSTTGVAATRNELLINDLNDDCLGLIFNKLPYVDRNRIENVCSRWFNASVVNWYSYMKRLRIGDDTGPFPYEPENSTEMNNAQLEKVLRRYGRYLEEISFTRPYYMKFNIGTIKLIVEHCPKLKRLNAGNLHLNNDDWMACSNLETLGFSLSAQATTGELGQLFHRNKRLKRLNIIGNPWCNTRDFDHLDADQLQCLQMTFCRNFELTAEIADKLADSLIEFEFSPHPNNMCNVQHLCKLRNLRSLTLTMDSGRIESKFVTDIANNCRKLERLSLIFLEEHICNHNVIEPLFRLHHLSELIITVGKNQIPFKELDKLFRNSPQLKLFVVCTCAVCVYAKGPRPHPYRNSCKIFSGVAANSDNRRLRRKAKKRRFARS